MVPEDTLIFREDRLPWLVLTAYNCTPLRKYGALSIPLVIFVPGT